MIRPKLQLPEAEEKILDIVEQYEGQYFAFDTPVPFLDGLTLYPVTVRHYYEFLSCSSCLTLNKNDDLKFLKAGHIAYLISKLEDKQEGPMWSFRFTKIIELCLHVPLGFHCPKCGKNLTFDEYAKLCQNPETAKNATSGICECGGHLSATIGYHKKENSNSYVLTINDVEIDDANFNLMRKLIMYQNLPSFRDDSYVLKSIRDDQALASKIRSRSSKQGNATLERKMCCIAAKSAYKIDEIYDMSIRKFEMFLGVINDAMEYQITKMGLMTGLVSFKDKNHQIDHWIYKPEETMYASGVDADSYTQSIH